MTMQRLGLLAGAILLAAAGRAGAQAPAPPPLDPAVLDAHLREWMAARRLPGLAAAVVDGDRAVLLRGYGDAGGGRPITAQTQFYIGSCTKSFTALAVMQLVARRTIDLDAPVRHYLPWFRVADEASSGLITVRHLLNQTSGLSEAGDPRPNDGHASLMDSARAASAVVPNARPGARFQYYNQNYRVLGALIEQVSGERYGDYLRAHVFAPLGMSRTTTSPGAVSDLAPGHAWFFGFSLPRPQPFDPGALSSGYLISTAEDLSHYVAALVNDGAYRGQAVADPAALAQLFALPAGVDARFAAPPSSVARIFGSSTAIQSGYAMGWLVARAPSGRRIVFHGGSLERFNAEILLLPNERRGVVLLVNRNGMLRPLFEPELLSAGLAELMVGDRPLPPPPVRWRVLLFALVVIVDLGFGVLRIARLPRWKAKAARRPRAFSWSLAVPDALVPALFLVAFPLLLTSLARVRITWLGFADAIPDLALWLFASASLSLARGLAKVAILVRGAARA